MTDIIKSENNVPIRFADMGDGTYAEVTATNLFASGANFNLIGDGKSLTSTGTSVSTLIPFDPTSLLAAGSVRVAVTDPGYIRIENTEAAASATDILVNPEDSILINTEGKRFISFVSLVGEATANIQPVGNNSFKMFESSLDLNFLSNEYVFNNDFVSFSSIATFSRNSAATFVGSNGLIQSAPANTPRFDYDPVTLQPRGFLIEEQSTNIRTQSENILVANAYSVANSTLTQVSAATPIDGLSVATSFVLNAGASALDNADGFNFGSGVSLVAGTTYAQSIFVKANPQTVFRIRNNVAGGTFDFTLTGSGTAPAPSGALLTASIQAFPNGWYRCSWTFTATGAAPGNRGDFWALKTNVADGVSGLLFTGAQLTTGAFVTSYIPTTTAQATRLADSAKIDGANFAAFYKQSEGTLMVEGSTASNLTTACAVSIDNNTGGNRIQLRRSGVGPSSGLRMVSTGGSIDVTLVSGTLGGINKIAVGAKNLDQSAASNGSLFTGITSISPMPNVSQMQIGNGAVSENWNGHIRRIMYIPKRLSNTELQALTI